MATRRDQSSETRNTQPERGGSSGPSMGGTGAATEERQSGGSGSGGTGGSARGSDEKASREAQRAIPTSGESMMQTRGDQPSRGVGRGRGRQGGLARLGFMRGAMPVTPWALMQHMSEELDRLVDSVALPRDGAPQTRSPQRSPRGDLITEGNGGGAAPTVFVPQIEVEHRDDALIVRADLPGLRPDDVDVTVDDGVLTIHGERRQVQREEEDGFVRSEVVYGAFYRTIPLPDGADESRTSAVFRDGVLEIAIPVTTGRARGRRIAVQPDQGQSQGQGQGQGR